MTQLNSSSQRQHPTVWEMSFREAAELLRDAATEPERCNALRALLADSSHSAAAWEAVRAFLGQVNGQGPLEGVLDSPEVCRLAALALSGGSESQMEELCETVRMATMPLFPTVRVMAEAVSSRADRRIAWFRDLIGEDPLARLRAAEVLMCAPAGSLSNAEGMAVTRYLFSQCSDDHVAMMVGGRSSVFFPYSDSAARIPVFFERHANSGSLAVAEVLMERSHILSHLALKMLVVHGDQRCIAAAFEHSLKRDRLCVVGFEEWPAAAIAAVEDRFVETLAAGKACGNILLSCIHALKKIRPLGNHEDVMFPLVERERWNSELARAVAGYVTAGTVSSAAVQHAREMLEPPREGVSSLLGLKRPSRYFIAARPSLGQVQLATAILDAAHEPFRRDLYRYALAARDISGRWLVGSSRVVVAAHLPPASNEASRELMRSSREDLQNTARFHRNALLEFAAGAELAPGFRIIDTIVETSRLDAEPVALAAEAVESLWVRAAGDERAQAAIATYVVSLAERFGGGLLRMDLCARFYSSITRIPDGSREAFARRLDTVRAEVRRNSMVAPSTELQALESLFGRSESRTV